MKDLLKNALTAAVTKVVSVFKTKAADSKAFSLNVTDIKKMLRNAFYVGAGAAVYYINEQFKLVDIGQLLALLHLEAYKDVIAPVIVPLIAGGLDALVKFFQSNAAETPETTDEVK